MSSLLGSRIKRLRETAGLNQAQIAQFLDVDQSTISKCENGDRQFQVDQLEQLGDLFGVPLKGLMADGGPDKPLRIAFRADAIENGDLAAIADLHRIALNLDQMRVLLGGTA